MAPPRASSRSRKSVDGNAASSPVRSTSKSPTKAASSKEEVKTTWGSGGLFANREISSLGLMIFTPIFVFIFWYICYHHKGSIVSFYDANKNLGIVDVIHKVYPTPFDVQSWKIIFSYMAFELLLMRFVPGKQFQSTITATGHIPRYTANGIECYLITIVTLFYLYLCTDYNPAIIYDKFGTLLSSMNLFAILLCAFLSFKGLNFPSTKDSGTNGNMIIDFFWGTELYPRIFGWDVKQFTNCRFGMMFWQVGIICYAMAQNDRLGYVSSSMMVSVIVQSVYIAKFFYWETGYFCTMDIQHDRAGYYICWGCLVWLPCMYTIHTYNMVQQDDAAHHLSYPAALFCTIAGIVCVWINYDCDRQRQEFRATDGKALVWGAKPTFITAKYTTKGGEVKTSLLLTSGWWGLARHIHYIPEIMASFFWCYPALFAVHAIDNFIPYFYFCPYIILLLVDRAWRDDARCGDKYAEYWSEYCSIVPYKILPGVI